MGIPINLVLHHHYFNACRNSFRGIYRFLHRHIQSDPLWFQALGCVCVLGFDWHSSGPMVVTGVLNQALGADVHGISVAGGKGDRFFTARLTLD